jgi:DNA polymerase-3 subunit beta
MKFSCTKENLSRSLNITSRITTKNINLPILNNVLIDIRNKNLKLQSTNLEIFIISKTRAKIEEEGSFTLPAKLFSDYINLLPEERIDIELIEGDIIKIECGKFKTKIKGISASEFPLIPEISKENIFKVKVMDFKQMIEKVVFAASSNEIRPELSGIFFKLDYKENKLISAATDSYRLAENKIEVIESSGKIDEKGIIVPAKTLQEVTRIIGILKELPESSNEMEIAVGDNQVLFIYDDVEILSRLIEGNYPEYQHIIPSDFKTTAVLNKEELIKAIKVASLFTKSNLNDVHLEFSSKGEKGELIVSSAENQIGENKISLDAQIDGEKNKIVLNYRYLIDGLNIFNTEKIRLQLNDESTPCVVQGVGEKECIYLVMPIKL